MKRLTNEEKQRIEELYHQGLMDSEIGKILNRSARTIWYYRNSRNLKTKFEYSKIAKIDNAKFEELFNQGLSDYKIAEILNMSPDGIFSHRIRHGYTRDSLKENKAIKLSDFQKQVLLGTLLGDASFRMSGINPSVSCAHGVKQKEYCEHKTEVFKSLGAKCNYHKRNKPDKRNGKCYEDYTMSIPANPELKAWYEAMYIPKKILPLELIKQHFTEVSLAYMYMDDGSKTNQSYTIATNCFEKENIMEFQQFLLDKFNIKTTIFKSNVLYIKVESKTIFENLISKCIIPSMRYKLHTVS
jgi:hypothetical protein